MRLPRDVLLDGDDNAGTLVQLLGGTALLKFGSAKKCNI